MPTYIVRNGQLEIRQKDFNVPNYRIIPYKSSCNPTHNDYITNTIDELQKQIHKANQDYRNLIQAIWKTFSHIDRTSYDPDVMFMGLKCDEIYDKISLIRGINGFQQEQESLRLSAIMKIDDNTPIYPIDSSEVSPARSKLRDEIKQDSLYEIQQEEECLSTSSHQQRNKQITQKQKNSAKQPQREKMPSPKGCPRLSLQNIASHKRDSSRGSRSSLLLRQKISLAFHEQQELKQLLESELQQIAKQLDQKSQYLNWTVQELKVRNDMIQRLKETIWQRDEALEIHQQKINLRQKQSDQAKYQLIVDEKDQQIGLLINSLIERTQYTSEDVQFLKKSIQASLAKAQNEPQTREEEEDKKINQSIYFDDLQNSARDQISDKIAKTFSIPSKQVSSQSETLQYSALRPKKMNFDSAENITYLTKEHFLLAQKSSQNVLVPNVKMTESLKVQNRSKSPDSSP